MINSGSYTQERAVELFAPASTTERIKSLDVLRGFALLGTLLVRFRHLGISVMVQPLVARETSVWAARVVVAHADLWAATVTGIAGYLKTEMPALPRVTATANSNAPVPLSGHSELLLPTRTI